MRGEDSVSTSLKNEEEIRELRLPKRLAERLIKMTRGQSYTGSHVAHSDSPQYIDRSGGGSPHSDHYVDRG